jgi:NTE family protein
MRGASAQRSWPSVALIFAGGVGLGSYQAGAYAAVHDPLASSKLWVAGSSIGATNAALIAGTRPDQRIEALRSLWNCADQHPDLSRVPRVERWQHLENWSSAIRARLLGSAGHFRPRTPLPWGGFKSFYDLSPLRERIKALVDFDRLNSGEVRVTVATTDVESGELVMFDTARGDRITLDHLMASCGYLPEFAPIEISGRLLGDGGLSANVPIEALLFDPSPQLTCYVIDLFARDGSRPRDLETALARKSDLTFANQTWLRLEAYCREQRLSSELQSLKGEHGTAATIYYLSYRPHPAEAGSERMFDYSERSLATRWRAGAADMKHALAMDTRHAESIRLVPVRRADDLYL